MKHTKNISKKLFAFALSLSLVFGLSSFGTAAFAASPAGSGTKDYSLSVISSDSDASSSSPGDTQALIKSSSADHASTPSADADSSLSDAAKDKLLDAIDDASTAKSLKTFNSSYSLSSSAGKKLSSAISSLKNAGYSVGILMIDINTGQGVVYDAGTKYYGASCTKGPYVAAINKYKLSSVTSSVKTTMKYTITESSNSDYLALRSKFGSSPMSSMMSYTNVSSSTLSPSTKYPYLAPKTLAKLWVGCYWYFFQETNSNSSWCRNLYTKSTMSFIRSALSGSYTTYTKPGWGAFSFGSAYNDAGVVDAGNNPYIMVVMSNAYSNSSYLKTIVKAIDAVHSDMVS